MELGLSLCNYLGKQVDKDGGRAKQDSSEQDVDGSALHSSHRGRRGGGENIQNTRA